MFAQYTTCDNQVLINLGKKYTGKVVRSGTTNLPITAVDRDGYAKIGYSIFLKFRNDIRVDDEKIDFFGNQDN